MKRKFKVLITISVLLNLLVVISAIMLIQYKGGWNFIFKDNIGTNYNTISAEKTEVFKTYPHSANDIVFLGDSITANGAWSEYYPDMQCRNRGIGGDKTDDVIKRLDEITDGKPKKVFMLIGINDFSSSSAEVILSNYKIIIDTLKRESPATKLYIESILPIDNDLKKIKTTNEGIEALNTEISDLCKENEVEFIDTFTHFIGSDSKIKSELTVDGLHLNPKGYRQLSEILKSYIYN